MIWLVWLLNFVISWFNAWACGTTWDATKQAGGVSHFMNWMGAIMSASGFTWCYVVLMASLGSHIPMQLLAEEGQVLEGMLLSAEMVQATMELGYMIVILPILGSGLAITIQSWRSLARRRHLGEARTGDYAVTGWNTFAQVSNTASFVHHAPGIMSNLGGFFGGNSSSGRKSGDGDDAGAKIVGLMILVAVLGGILTTYGILNAARARGKNVDRLYKQELDNVVRERKDRLKQKQLHQKRWDP